ncbi:cold shock-like protein CspA [Aspergillus minisclerotigenes]|uniref:Cold shock-like protein CspA n=1 Tax=Aspergillus minisclerotigenes TaxID=656917 RepID=A0A5N6IPN7_9EURO|nr:cold shock-like protein CspA [Aspergillus minisclerotigenes]
MADREEGVVKWFNSEKGFGFITRDSVGDDIFVHFRAIATKGVRELHERQRVTFQVSQGNKGLQAESVEIEG